MFIIDAHLDLAINALEWNRNLKTSVFEIRARETSLGTIAGTTGLIGRMKAK